MSELAELVENRPSEKLVERLEKSADEMDAFDFSRTDYRVCISLREDYLPHLETLKTIMPALMENRMRLAQMTGTQAVEAVVKPGGALVTPEVARTIVEFVSGARGGSAERLAELDVEPPLLSVICRELNERRRALGQERITADLVTGNRREILHDFYERSVGDLPADMRAFVEDKLLTKSGFRDNLALETALEEPGVTRPLIDTLVSRRLLRLEDRIGVQRVELTHDVLAEVIRAARDARQQRLAVAEAEQRERLALAAAARQARRQRFLIAGLAAIVVTLGIGAGFGLRAQRRAAEQAARVDLATGSRLLDEGKVGEGLAYLVSAARREATTGEVVATRILSTLTSRTFSLPVGAALKLPAATEAIQFLPGGRSALVLGDDGRVRLIDALEWKVVREYSFNQKVQPAGLRTAAKNADLFAVALVDGTVVACDTATGRLRFVPFTPPARMGDYSRWRLAQKIAWVPNFGLSADGRWLRTVNDSVAVFDTATGEERFVSETWNPLVDITAAAFHFSPDGTRMVTAGGTVTGSSTAGWSLPNPTMEFRSVPDGKVLATFPADPAFGGINRQGTMFSADGKRLLTLGAAAAGGPANNNYVAFAYDTEKLAPIGPAIPFNRVQVGQVWLTPDGTRVIMASDDRTTTVYDVATGKPAFPALKHGGPATLAGLSEDSGILATVSVDGLCRLWDLKTGTLAAEATYKQDRPSPAALSPDGRTLLVSSASGLLHRLQLTGRPAAPLALPYRLGGANLSAAPVLALFAPQPPARLLWFERGRAKVFEIASGRWTDGGFNLPFFLNANAASLVSRSYADTLRPGDAMIARPLAAGLRRAWVMGENGVAQNVALADMAAGNFPFTVSGSGKFGLMRDLAAQTTGIWDLRSGQRIAVITGVTALTNVGQINEISPDDRRLAINEPKTEEAPEGIRVYEISGGKFLFKIVSDDKAVFRSARFSADSTRLLTGNSWGKVQVWDAATGKPLHSNQAHGFSVSRFDFSGDGRLYASLSQEGTVQVWDAATHQPLGGPLVHSGAVARATFNADNTRLTTAAIDGSGRVWDVRAGLPLNDPTGESAGVAAFAPDERFVMTGAGSATAQRLWAAPPSGRAGRAPKWLLQLATICAARRLNDEGKLVSAAEEFDQLDELRREIAALPEGDAHAEWARWFLSDNPARPIAPGFTVTPAEAKKLADEMSAPDPLIAWTARDNALLLEGKHTEAEPIEREMLAWVRQRDGEEGPYLDSHLIKLAQSLVMVGKFAEAEKLARESLAAREKIGARESYGVQSARATIGSALVGQKRYAEAEPLLTEACDSFKKLGAQSDLNTVQIKNRYSALAELYEATGRPEKAAEWKALATK